MFGNKQHFSKGIALLLKAIKEMEEKMAIKVSELGNEITAMRNQVVKIWGEQQTKYDALKAQYDDVVKQLENAELSPDAEKAVTDFKTQLQAFDDTIPDTTT